MTPITPIKPNASSTETKIDIPQGSYLTDVSNSPIEIFTDSSEEKPPVYEDIQKKDTNNIFTGAPIGVCQDINPTFSYKINEINNTDIKNKNSVTDKLVDLLNGTSYREYKEYNEIYKNSQGAHNNTLDPYGQNEPKKGFVQRGLEGIAATANGLISGVYEVWNCLFDTKNNDEPF